MAEKKKGGGKLTRTEIVTVRFDPRTRFAVELAARCQRRTVSNYIESVVEESIRRVVIREGDDTKKVSLKDVVDRTWDVDEPDRFAKLALNHPELLTYDGEVLWKLIRENEAVWDPGEYDPDAPELGPSEATLNFIRLREHWGVFKQVAAGELPPDNLPKLERTPDPFEDDVS